MNSKNGEIYNKYNCICFMPDGSPVPELLTEEEAIKFLRLDEDGPKEPKLTLLYYRDKGLLKPTRVGKRLRYQRVELLRFLDSLTNGKI